MRPKPGDYHEFVRRFRLRSLAELQETHRKLPETGCGWRTANYRRALEAVIAEKEIDSDPVGAIESLRRDLTDRLES
jgi:hypothetical protein